MKKLFFLLIAVFALSVSAFADSSYFANSMTITTSGGDLYEYISGADPVFFYLKPFQTDSYQVVAISEIQGASFTRRITRDGESPDDSTYTCGNRLSSDYDLWISGVAYAYGSTCTFVPNISVIPSVWTNNDIAEAFMNYVENLPPDVTAQSTFALPCGNVAYFQVSSAQTVDFKSSYQILSSPFANSTYGYWSDSGQRFGPAASLPTSSTSFPIASQDPLYWTPDPQSKNLLGLSQTGLASESCIIGQWYAFYNPAYNSNNTDWTTMDITGATVFISGSFSAIKIFPLEQVIDYQNGAFVGGSNDDYQSYFDGNIGADGSVSFTNQDGVSSTPAAGGQNLLAPNETAQSLIEKVVGILQNLLSEIQSLFTFGYDAIQSLVGIMSSFVSSFSQLYTWLPTEVYSALISAVIIAVIIGIFKVFL